MPLFLLSRAKSSRTSEQPPSGLVTVPATVSEFVQGSSKESTFAYLTTIGHSWLVVRLAHAHVVVVVITCMQYRYRSPKLYRLARGAMYGKGNEQV